MTGSDSSPLVRNTELDTSGLDCPLPLLKARLELDRLSNGGVLKVIITDIGPQRDFRALAWLTGRELLREGAAGGVYRYWLHKH